MRNTIGNLGIFPSFSMIILSVGLMNHVLVIPQLLDTAKRDAWISVLLLTFPYLLWVSIIYAIVKRTNQQSLFWWLQQRYGAGISWVFRIFFVIYLFLIGTISLEDTVTWTHISYLPRTPDWILSMTLMILCIVAAQSGIRTMAITSGILLPFVILFGDFVLSANLPAKDYSLLIPLFENGMEPVLQGSIYAGGGLAEFIIILLIQHQIKSQIRLRSLWILALFLLVLVLGPLTGAIAEFGPFEAAKLRYPAYEEWRLVKIGHYIQHIDFLSIYQWLSGSFIRISLSLFLLIDILEVNKKHRKTVWLLFFGFLMVVTSILPISDMQYLSFLKNVYFPVSLVTIIAVTFILLILVLKGGLEHGR